MVFAAAAGVDLGRDPGFLLRNGLLLPELRGQSKRNRREMEAIILSPSRPDPFL
jgi:hypothetical protein